MRPALLLAAFATLAAGCSTGEAEPSDVLTASSHEADPAANDPRVVGTAAAGLEVPWGIAFLPGGTALVTERDLGQVVAITTHQLKVIGRVAETAAEGEAGLLGIAVSPTYTKDQRVFLYVTTDEDNRIVRTTYDGSSLGQLEPILTGIPRGSIHDGGRLAFGPDGFLYASTGETGDGPLAQDRESLGGKILRITQDGAPAPGNPDPASPIWSWGHRNVQGLAFDDDGRLWASEFGAQTWDELNLVTKGGNYGWPEVEGAGGDGRFLDPEVVWNPAQNSPSGLAWRDGQLWLGSLRGQRLWRIDVHGARAREPTDFFVGQYGRLRTVVVAPDGNLWVTTSNRDGRGDPREGDDRILVVDPG